MRNKTQVSRHKYQVNNMFKIQNSKSSIHNFRMTYDLRLTTIFLLLAINYQLSTINCFSQGVGINASGAPADNSALLDVSAIGKGLLLPRMTTAQRPASPRESLIIFNTDSRCFEAFNGSTWTNMWCLSGGCNPPASPTNINGTVFIPCTNSSMITYNINDVPGATSYTWKVPDNYWVISSGQGTTSITVYITGNIGHIADISVTADNNCGKSSAASLSVTVEGTPATPGPISGDSIVCGVQDVSLTKTWTIDPVPGSTLYEWGWTPLGFPDGWDLDTGQGTASLTLFVPRNASVGQINVKAGNACGWSDVRTFKVTVKNPCFECGTSTVKDADGNSYNTVQIGTQCWLKENLNVGTRINGNGANNQANNGIIEKFCYGDDVNNCNVYGGLYQWNEMMQYVTTEKAQGICPAGWHIPSDLEWYTMENYLDPTVNDPAATGPRGTDAGGKLKEAGLTHWGANNDGATNESGFTGLGGGWRNEFDLIFYDLNSNGYWATSTLKPTNSNQSWYHSLINWSATTVRYNITRSVPLSVRCIKD